LLGLRKKKLVLSDTSAGKKRVHDEKGDGFRHIGAYRQYPVGGERNAGKKGMHRGNSTSEGEVAQVKDMAAQVRGG